MGLLGAGLRGQRTWGGHTRVIYDHMLRDLVLENNN
jgi:hypothetical protein